MPQRRSRSAGPRRPFLASFFTPTKSTAASRLTQASGGLLGGRRARVARQAAAAQPGSFLRELSSARAGTAGAVRAERRRRRRAVRSQYLREARRLKESRARAEQALEKQLVRRERVIVRQRGLFHYDPDNPQQARAKEFADRRYRTVERQQRERHTKQWEAAKHDLERSRDAQYRDISRQLRDEQRQTVGLPPALQGGLPRLSLRLPGSGSEGGAGAGEGWRLPSWERDKARGSDWRVGGPAAPDRSSSPSPGERDGTV